MKVETDVKLVRCNWSWGGAISPPGWCDGSGAGAINPCDGSGAGAIGRVLDSQKRRRRDGPWPYNDGLSLLSLTVNFCRKGCLYPNHNVRLTFLINLYDSS